MDISPALDIKTEVVSKPEHYVEVWLGDMWGM